MRTVFWPAGNRLASQEGLCSVEYVSMNQTEAKGWFTPVERAPCSFNRHKTKLKAVWIHPLKWSSVGGGGGSGGGGGGSGGHGGGSTWSDVYQFNQTIIVNIIILITIRFTSLEVFLWIPRRSWSLHREKRLLASSCLSVSPHGTIRLNPDVLSWSLIFEYFSTIWREFRVSLIADKNNGYFTWKITPFFITSRSIVFKIKNASDQSGRENQNTHFVFNNIFRKFYLLWDNLEK